MCWWSMAMPSAGMSRERSTTGSLRRRGVWDIPRHWLQQLRDDGRLVAPIWLDGVQVSASFVAQGDGAYVSVDNRPCAFVYLQGHAAGPRLRNKVGSTSLVVLADDVDKVDTAALHLLLSERNRMAPIGQAFTTGRFLVRFCSCT